MANGGTVESTATAWRNETARLRGEVRGTLRPGRPVVLVDLPPYLNLGDSLIALGELALVRGPGIDFRGAYGATIPGRVLERVDRAGGTIAIHGGGNLGSIWPHHQALKERIAAECRRARVVQLPQSVHFDSDAEAAEAFGRLRSHPDFVLFVRDEPSRAIAVAHGMEQVRAAIDGAFVYDMGAPRSPSVDVCVLARADRERCIDRRRLVEALEWRGLSPVACDWARHDDLPRCVPRWRVEADKMALRVIARTVHRGRILGGSLPATGFYRNRLAIARHVVCAGRVLVTDRLHGHVLAVLLGQPHVWLDNSYGKIGRFAAAWGTESPVARSARTAEEAAILAEDLLGRSPAGPPRTSR